MLAPKISHEPSQRFLNMDKGIIKITLEDGRSFAAQLQPVIDQSLASLPDLPAEILFSIFSLLGPRDILSCALTARDICNAALSVIYRHPDWSDLAKPFHGLRGFIYSISTNQYRADFVRKLTLNRDWVPLRTSDHNAWLQYSKGKGAQAFDGKTLKGKSHVPLGVLVHILKCCRNLELLELDDIHMIDDFHVVLPDGRKHIMKQHKDLRKPRIDLLHFTSDYEAKSWPSSAVKKIQLSELVDAINALSRLKRMSFINCHWLNRATADDILTLEIQYSRKTSRWTRIGIKPWEEVKFINCGARGSRYEMSWTAFQHGGKWTGDGVVDFVPDKQGQCSDTYEEEPSSEVELRSSDVEEWPSLYT